MGVVYIGRRGHWSRAMAWPGTYESAGFYPIWVWFFLAHFIFVFCTQFDGTTYSNHHIYITQFKLSNIYYIYGRYTRVLPCIIYISFIALQSSYGILLPALGPLDRGIHIFPLEDGCIVVTKECKSTEGVWTCFYTVGMPCTFEQTQ